MLSLGENIEDIKGPNVERLVKYLSGPDKEVIEAPFWGRAAQKATPDRRAEDLLKAIKAGEEIRKMSSGEQFLHYMRDFYKSLTMARALAYVNVDVKVKNRVATPEDYAELERRMLAVAALLDMGFLGFGNELGHFQRDAIRSEAHDELRNGGFTKAAGLLARKKPWWEFWKRSRF